MIRLNKETLCEDELEYGNTDTSFCIPNKHKLKMSASVAAYAASDIASGEHSDSGNEKRHKWKS